MDIDLHDDHAHVDYRATGGACCARCGGSEFILIASLTVRGEMNGYREPVRCHDCDLVWEPVATLRLVSG